MYDYKVLKIPQPFYHNNTCNDYDKFQTDLMGYLNTGYEIVHSEDVSYNYYDTESFGKIFILKKPK